MSWASNITETTGETPIVELQRLTAKMQGKILAKLEFFNPTSSVKDRIAVNMINAAEDAGLLKPGGTIVEPTSGNTGVGLAMVAAARGYKMIIVMPEGMSRERRALMRMLGAKIELTPDELGMRGAIDRAEEIVCSINGAFMPGQFDNPANLETHYTHTGPEIWRQTEGKIDFLVAAIGTGGTLIGTAKYLKEQNPAIRIIAVEPENSSILCGGTPGPHAIQGIGPGFVPGIIDLSLIDRIIPVSDKEAVDMTKLIARKEGILAGISSGANIAASMKVAADNPGIIVTLLPDTGERYLSTVLFEDEFL